MGRVGGIWEEISSPAGSWVISKHTTPIPTKDCQRSNILTKILNHPHSFFSTQAKALIWLVISIRPPLYSSKIPYFILFSSEWVVRWNSPKKCPTMIRSRLGMGGERKEEKRARYEGFEGLCKKLGKKWNSQSIPLLCCLNLRKHCRETERCSFLKNDLPSGQKPDTEMSEMNSQKVEQKEKDFG